MAIWGRWTRVTGKVDEAYYFDVASSWDSNTTAGVVRRGSRRMPDDTDRWEFRVTATAGVGERVDLYRKTFDTDTAEDARAMAPVLYIQWLESLLAKAREQ